jgi:CRISP-associated protein Cas1
LFFANPAYLSTKDEQLVINPSSEDTPPKTVPIEDIGFLVLENPQITISTYFLFKFLAKLNLD